MKNYNDYYRKLITSQYRYSEKFMAWQKSLLTFVLSNHEGSGIGVTMTSMTYSCVDGVGVTDNVGNIEYEPIGVVIRNIDYATSRSLALRDDGDARSIATNIIEGFDVDSAVGVQLDIIGRIVGVSRILKFQPTQDSPVMTDKVYRLCIKAKIIQNQWKGNAEDLTAAWMTLFPETKIFEIQDLQDMSFNIVISGDFSTLEREIITNGYILPKPQGVRINTLNIVDMTGLPLFSYDYDTLYMSGYGSHWSATN